MSKFGWLLVFFVVCPTLILISGCSSQPPNIILISLDTVRPDHLSAYGYEKDTTPFLQEWAASDAVLFENAVTPETWTLPAHMSVFTGLQPKTHGVTSNTPLPASIQTLPEWLKKLGYATAGFTGHTWWFQKGRGFERGMDTYDPGPDMFRHLYETRDLAMPWMAQAKEPFFLFFHSYDAHYKIPQEEYVLPYDSGDPKQRVFSEALRKPDSFQRYVEAGKKASEILKAHRDGTMPLTAEEQELVVALYDDCLRMQDDFLRALVTQLRETGRYDNTMIVIFSDHGEGLNERGYYDHEDVWEEECRVPLIVKLPDQEHGGTRVAAQVQLTSIFSTILEVLREDADPAHEATSLLAALEPDYTGTPAFIRNGGARVAIRAPDWKLHWRNELNQSAYALFQLSTDPVEQKNIYKERAQVSATLQPALERFHGFTAPGWHVELVAERGTEWRGELTLEADSEVVAASIYDYWGNVRNLEISDGRRVEVVLGEHPPERVMVETKRSVKLHVKGEAPFDLQVGDEITRGVTEWRKEIQPALAPTLVAATAENAEGPLVRIWFKGR